LYSGNNIKSTLFVPRLLLITPFNGEQKAMLEVFESALQGGVDAVLLRKHGMESGRLLALAAQLRLLTKQYNARLLIHSQGDICLAVDADGVHLSSRDIADITAMRAYLGESKSVSTSCHDAAELQHAASLGADFALLSPVFSTSSHPNAIPLGVEHFMQLSKESPLPVMALGGIDGNNRHRLFNYGVAVISSICNAKSPKQAALALL